MNRISRAVTALMSSPRGVAAAGVLTVLLWAPDGAWPQPLSARLERLDAEDLAVIASRVAANETGGDAERLLWWNDGEHFMSLGIGHFIWYPAGAEKPYRESFPALLAEIETRGTLLPAWLDPTSACPWPDRAAWLAALAAGEARVAELRELVGNTTAIQAAMLVRRLRDDLATLFDDLSPLAADRLRERLQRVASTPDGVFALVDYVNFKGDGRHPGERYAGEGWGLLQVLAAMHDDEAQADPLDAFADAAGTVLRRRVLNAPASRDESRWLAGWLRRVDGYRPR